MIARSRGPGRLAPLRLLLLLVPLAVVSAPGCARSPRDSSGSSRVALSDGWLALGTFFEAELQVDRREVDEGRAYLDWARDEIERLERVYSRHDPTSAVSALNRALADPDVLRRGARIDPELEAILFAALEVWEASGGAFDITVGPLVEVWNEAAEAGRWPPLDALRRAKRRVGGERLLLPGEGVVDVTVRDVRIDLDGIAKGVVLDRLRDELVARLPGTPALLSFGGSSVFAIGAPEGEAGWRLDVRSRDDALGGLGRVELRDRALSVSSSAGQARAIEGKPVSHVIDPRTGTPVEARVEAIVISPRATPADAWSTALLVLGARPSGLRRLEEAGLEGLVMELGGRSAATGGWERAVSGSPASAAD